MCCTSESAVLNDLLQTPQYLDADLFLVSIFNCNENVDVKMKNEVFSILNSFFNNVDDITRLLDGNAE